MGRIPWWLEDHFWWSFPHWKMQRLWLNIKISKDVISLTSMCFSYLILGSMHRLPVFFFNWEKTCLHWTGWGRSPWSKKIGGQRCRDYRWPSPRRNPMRRCSWFLAMRSIQNSQQWKILKDDGKRQIGDDWSLDILDVSHDLLHISFCE